MSVACPDCTGTAIGRHLDHDDTCPLGEAIEQMCAADQAWFERHPFATERDRRITPAEIAELRAFGVVTPGTDPTRWRVRVRLLEPGIRARHLHDEGQS